MENDTAVKAIVVLGGTTLILLAVTAYQKKRIRTLMTANNRLVSWSRIAQKMLKEVGDPKEMMLTDQLQFDIEAYNIMEHNKFI